MIVSVVVPSLGSGIDQVEVVMWHKKEGDFVTQQDDLVELVTDKASFFVPAPVCGKIKKIRVLEGSSVLIGNVLADIEQENG